MYVVKPSKGPLTVGYLANYVYNVLNIKMFHLVTFLNLYVSGVRNELPEIHPTTESVIQINTHLDDIPVTTLPVLDNSLSECR